MILKSWNLVKHLLKLLLVRIYRLSVVYYIMHIGKVYINFVEFLCDYELYKIKNKFDFIF